MASIPKLPRRGSGVDAAGWLRSLAIALLAAIFLATAGAFGSYAAPVSPRFGYWIGLMLLGSLWGTLVSRFVFRPRARAWPTWARVIIASLTIAIPFSAIVAMAGRIALHIHYSAEAIPGLLASVTAVSLVMVAINVLVVREARGVTSASTEPPKFLDRLPLKLRGAEVWAIEAQDHYLRLHTSKGQDLILMRLSDAIAELEGIEGAQAHRSWWVARDAITAARRGDGRATLTLKDGAEVPVSRTHARLLRERGWF
ncbi:LytTR family DNA-binding domain-containing protein [Phenylobacterium sp.]|uniref:LytTR family DNA-binding domain-containing protein n=1 Tax=Phenylobacterium sp. TaxID=1871053 RepID=UPI00286AE34C|nr:LytTR family DNA-binding domain-containing protein [Phenylobacterium sp.]